MDVKIDSLMLGVVVEKRVSDHPWLDHEWVFVAVIPGAPPASGLRVLREDKGVTQFHAGTLDLELHRAEAEAYHYNLSSAQPSLFVVLRDGDEAALDAPIHVSLVTANPYEAQDYLASVELDGIHAYILQATYPDGTAGYDILTGAFSGVADARPLQLILRGLGFRDAPLVERRGRLPE